MTQNASFKKKIRDRMTKTGERYAAARLALLQKSAGREVPAGIALVDGYRLIPAVHSDSALLGRALAQAGVRDPATGAPFSEAKLYGLSGGIGFLYFLFEYDGHPPMLTFNCRTWTLPGPLVDRALLHAGIEARVRETGAAKAAHKDLEETLSAGGTAHLTVDDASLPWSGQPPMWQGQMPRQLNVVGRAGEDFAVDAVAVRPLSPAALAKARAACKKERHRLLAFAPHEARAAPDEAVRAALRYTARSFHEAPFRGFQNNFGLKGMEKAARLMVDEKDKKGWPRVFSSGPLAFLALLRTWECATTELTAPAGGRPFYASFLREAARLPGLAALDEAAALAERSGEHFASLAEDATAAGGPALLEAVELSEEIDELRRDGGDDDGQRVRALLHARAGLALRCDLDEGARRAAYAQLAEHFVAIAEIERELSALLAEVAG